MKRAIAACISLALLAALFFRVDRHQLWESFRSTRLDWFVAAMLLFIPQIAAISWRWKRLIAPFASISMGESVSLVLASQSMNLILPAKMGDLTKAYFLARGGSLDLPRALNLVIFEKLLDVGTLAAVMVCGVAVSLGSPALPPAVKSGMIAAALLGAVALAAVAVIYVFPMRLFEKLVDRLRARGAERLVQRAGVLIVTGHEVMSMLQSKGSRRGRIVMWSVVIWILHLTQIYCFFRSVHVASSVGQFLAMTPLAIFIGLIPISIAGFGTRDHAFVVLFPQAGAAAMASASMYVNLRYILPALVGLPFVNRSLALKPKTAERDSDSRPR